MRYCIQFLLLIVPIIFIGSCSSTGDTNSSCVVDIVDFTLDVNSFNPGANVTGKLILDNNGNDVSVQEGTSLITFYLSDNTSYSTTDIELSGFTSNAIEGTDEEKIEMNFSADIPFDTETGPLYLLAHILGSTYACDEVFLFSETRSIAVDIL